MYVLNHPSGRGDRQVAEGNLVGFRVLWGVTVRFPFTISFILG